MDAFGTLAKTGIALALGAICAGAADPELTVPYRSYKLPLESYVPAPNLVEGMLLRVRINGGPVLRLLLDTGAADVTIDKRSAERSGLKATEPLQMVCPGQPSQDSVKAGVAES